MQLATIQKNVETFGEPTKVRRFELRQTVHTIRLFTDTYSNPKASIVREYLSNVLDAYAKMPKDRLFIKPIVQLPTPFDSTLKFIDFGVGMSHDTVWEVFPFMGDSTKRDNNDEIGGFGLGAKSAFAYEAAEQWSVESRFNGEKMLFNAYFDSEGWPTFAHVVTQATDEPNGVTISIPIAKDDVEEFVQAVADFLEFFPIEVDVRGSAEFEVTKTEALLEGTGWRLRKGGSSRVVVGPVAYPVETRHLTLNVTEDWFRTLVSYNGVDIFVPIGSVDIVPNREQLIFGERTKAEINKVVRKMQSELTKKIAEKVDGAKTKYELLRAVKPFWYVSGLRQFVEGVAFNGQLITPGEGIKLGLDDFFLRCPDAEIAESQMYERGHRRRSYDSTRVYRATDFDTVRPSAVADLHYNVLGDETVVVIDDLPRTNVRASARLREHLQLSHWSRGKSSSVHTIIIKAANLTAEQLSKRWGGIPVLLASTFPLPPVKPKKPRPKVSIKEYNRSVECWYAQDVEQDHPAYFVRSEKNEPADFSGSFLHVQKILEMCWEQEMIDKSLPIYAIPRTLKKAETYAEWIDLHAFLKEILPVKAKELAVQHAEYNELKALSDEHYTLVNFFTKADPAQLKRNSLPHKLVTRLQELTKVKSLEDIEWLFGVFDIEIPTRKVQNSPVKLFDRLIEQYPMMNFVSSSCYSDHEVAIYNYLNRKR